MEIINGKNVSFHYIGTLDDGTEFDSSYTRGEPMSGLVGDGKLISGFENALLGMKANEKKSIVIESKDAYGEFNPKAIQIVPLTSFPEDFEGIVGKVVQGKAENGNVFTAVITEVVDDNFTLDFNHPLAGKNLNFDIEIVSVSDADVDVNAETTDDVNE
jgi:peptidylprolyl isomerase